MQPNNTMTPNQPNPTSNRPKTKKPHILTSLGVLLLVAIATVTYFTLKPVDTDQLTNDTNNVIVEPVEKEFTSEDGISVHITSTFNNENATVTSPLEFTGRAPRAWGNDATFAVRLMGHDNNLLAESMAMFDGNWFMDDTIMEGIDKAETEGDTVPFTVELEFEAPPAGTTGQLILNRDNSGLFEEPSDSIVIDVKF